jgi:trimeric autotransporter adhesin
MFIRDFPNTLSLTSRLLFKACLVKEHAMPCCPLRSIASLRTTLVRATLLASLLAGASPALAQSTCTPQWSSLGGVTGVDNQVAATTVWDPDGPGPRTPLLVVAGEHDVAGSVISPNVAAWDGTQWLSLNTDGLDGVIDALAVLGNDLIVGGSFSSIGGVAAENVARLTSTGWQPLGAGLDSRVYALGVYNGQIFAGGEFMASGSVTVRRLARWNGTAWGRPGTAAGANEPIMAFINVGTDLVAVGSFTSISGVAASRIARWNGTAWSAMGAGLNEQVRTGIVFGNELYVGGWFTGSGSTTLAGSAKWNGSAWVPPFAGTDNTQNVYNFAALNGSLYATGSIAAGNGFGYEDVARLTPTGWEPLSADPDEQSGVFASYTITTFDNALHVSGLFRTEGDNAATRIARWTGDTWAGLGTGNSARVFGGITFQGKAVMFGDFRQLGGVPVRGIAQFDGSTWAPLGAGITDGTGTPGAACIWNDNLVVVGNFDSVNNQPMRGVAIWNGTTWTSLSQPLAGDAQGCTVLNGSLYVGGSLYTESGAELGTVVRWTGTTWQPVGPANNPGTNGPVYAMATYNNKVYVGGEFTQAGSLSANGVAAWNGTSWENLPGDNGNGVNGGVGKLFVYRDELIVGARLFTQAGGQPAKSIARWNGSRWAQLGNGLDFPATVAAMIERDGKLLVGGLFETTDNGSLTLNGVGLYDGETDSWSALGSGVNQYVTGFAYAGSDVIAGGLFSIMDGQASGYVARLACPGGTCDSIDFNADTLFPTDEDLIDFLSVLAGGPCSPGNTCNDIDFNNDGLFPSDDDLVAFLRVLAGGNC